jgi:DNA repair exonuclease SbcCD nuclease subunit
VDAVTCGGDLYEHERVTPDTQAFLVKTFTDYPHLKFLISPGNHDWYGPKSIYKHSSWPKNVFIFTESRLTPYALNEEVTIWGGAHHGEANAGNFLTGFYADGSGAQIGLFHGSASLGIESESKKERHAPFKEEEIAQAGLAHALLGHFHNATEKPTYTYPGNPDPLTFGESSGRGAVLVTIEGPAVVDRKWHDVSQTKVSQLVVVLDGEASSSEIVSRVKQELRDLTGYVRVLISGEIAESTRFNIRDLEQENFRNLEGIVFKVGNIRSTLDYAALAQEQSVRGAFVRDVMGASNLTEEEKSKVLMTGLRALAGDVNDLMV